MRCFPKAAAAEDRLSLSALFGIKRGYGGGQSDEMMRQHCGRNVEEAGKKYAFQPEMAKQSHRITIGALRPIYFSVAHVSVASKKAV